VKRAAIILAGGQAKRFQVKSGQWVDKALAKLFGKPLLIHIIERINPVVEEIIICVNNEARKLRYSKVLRDFSIENVKICTDKKFSYVEGPAVAIATGLKTANANYCIILPCDTPLIQPSVIDYMFNAAKGTCIAVPIHPDGRLETLMIACDRLATTHIAETLCEVARDRPDDIIRGAPNVNFVSTIGELKDLDPEFKSFININFREDLTRLPTRVVEEGPIRESIRLKLGSPTELELNWLKETSKLLFEGKILEASSIFSSLSTLLERKGLNFWAGLCREKEGEILFGLSSRRGDVKKRGDYYVKGKAAFMKAMENYASEAEIYDKNQIDFLAKRARADGLWCQRRVNARVTSMSKILMEDLSRTLEFQ